MKARRLADPEKYRNWDKIRYYKSSQRKEAAYKKKYGIGYAERDAIFVLQGSKCAICPETSPGGKHKTWHTDHNHTTGKVRGILCQNCNIMIGMAREQKEVLANAIIYLQEHNV